MNPHRARYLLEQADKIKPLERQISEAGLWGALTEAAGKKPENFEERVVDSAN